MSYILDALKRAESERERGGIPGLHSQSVALSGLAGKSRAGVKPLVGAGAGLALVLSSLFALLAWRLSGPDIMPSGGTMPGVPASSQPASQVAVATPALTAAVPMIITSPAADTASTALPTHAPLDQGAVTHYAVKPRISSVSEKPELLPQPVAKRAATPAAPNSSRIVPVSELPADVRQTLPKVVISGSTYSDNQALRMLIINGEVFREGDKPAPDLQLEQIRVKSAVLNFKGLRYSMAY